LLELIYVSLQHVVVLLFGRQRFLEHGDVPLVIYVLLIQGFHLGANRQHFLVSSRNLGSEFFQLKIRLDVSWGSWAVGKFLASESILASNLFGLSRVSQGNNCYTKPKPARSGVNHFCTRSHYFLAAHQRQQTLRACAVVLCGFANKNTAGVGLDFEQVVCVCVQESGSSTYVCVDKRKRVENSPFKQAKLHYTTIKFAQKRELETRGGAKETESESMQSE
jgi:hypothetical protein